MVKLSDESEAEVSFPVNYTATPTDQILVNDPVQNINLHFEEKASNLVYLQFIKRKSPVNISLANMNLIQKGDKYYGYLFTSHMVDYISRQLELETNIIAISPDTLVFVFEDRESRTIPVRLKTDISLEKQYVIYDSISIIPETTFEMFDVDEKVAMSQALKNRSDITDYEIREEQAKKNLETTISNNSFTADIRARVGLNQTGSHLDEAYKELLDQESINVTFSVPLFQWGKADSEIEAALINKEQVELDNRHNRKLFETQVKFQTLRFKQLQKQVLVASKSDTIAQRRFDVAYKRFMIGKIDMNDLFLAQNEKNAAFQTYITTLKSYWVAYYSLRQTTLYDFKTNSPIEYKLSAFKK